MKTRCLAIALIVFGFDISFADAQSQREPKKYDNPQWQYIRLAQFKEGRLDRVKEIMKLFEAAAEKAQTQIPMRIELSTTGEWNMITIWNYKEGIKEMDWGISPDNLKWMAALTDAVGGMDKVKILLDEWNSLIVRTTSYVGRRL